jgi:transposase
MHYATYSPYRDLVPPISDLWTQPFHFFSMWKHVIILHEQHKNVRATEEKLARQNDNMKQRYYRKMHGIEEKNPIHSVFGKPQDDKTDAQIEAEALGRELTEEEIKEVKPERKKWLGIW